MQSQYGAPLPGGRGGPPPGPGYQSTPNFAGYQSGYGSQAGPGYGPQPGYGAPPGGAPPPGYGSQFPPAQPPGYGSNAGYGSYPQASYDQSHFFNQISPNELNQLRQWFAAVDKDRSGRISVQELSSMNFGGLRFSYETARLLIKVFDRDRDGEIDFQEYASLHKFIGSMHQAFLMYDADRSGTIEIGEATLAVQQGGFMLSPPTMNAAFRRFLVPGNRGLSLEHFMCLCAFLGMCRSAFHQLDTSRSGWVYLNLDQFILVTSTLG